MATSYVSLFLGFNGLPNLRKNGSFPLIRKGCVVVTPVIIPVPQDVARFIQ